MFLRVIEERYVHGRWGHEAVRRRDLFSCDECETEFSLGYKSSHACSNSLTFCCKACNKQARSVGCLAQKWKRTKLERYGVEHSSQVPGASEKMIVTRIARTGAAGPSDPISTSNPAFKETMIERHSVDHPSCSTVVKEKKVRTYRDRYGVKNPFSAGSPFRKHDDHVKGGQAGYRALIKRLGDTALSKPEALMAKFLREHYGNDNIDQQVEVQHGKTKPWLIDFKIITMNTYVQVDGVFWHGLDRQYEELHETKRAQYDADRQQDEWFRTRGIKLVRVSDRDILSSGANCILDRMEG